MKPRVLLIKTAPAVDRPSVAPPLGIMQLAGAIHGEADVTLYDAGLDMYGTSSPPVDEVRALVEDTAPLLIGFSTLTCEHDCLLALAAVVKRTAPEAIVVVGGPYPTAEPESWRASPHIDWALRGEADETLPRLLRRLVAGRDLMGIPGLVGRDTPGPQGKAPAIEDLDGLPLPAHDLIDLRRYSDPRYRNHSGLPAFATYACIATSRGCPYRCAYCQNVHGRSFRAMSPARVLREVDGLVAAGARELHFADDVFNLDVSRATAILDGLAERHPQLRLAFPNGLRGDLIDREFVTAAQRAGTRYVALAVETASPRLQEAIGKRVNLNRIERALSWFEEAGIRTRLFIMLGFPTETVEEMEASIRFAIDSSTSEVSFFNVVPFAGTPLFDLAESFAPGIAEETTQAPLYAESSFYERATGVSVSRLRGRAMLRFYFSRGRLIKLLRSIPPRFWFSRAFLETVSYFGRTAVRGLLSRPGPRATPAPTTREAP